MSSDGSQTLKEILERMAVIHEDLSDPRIFNLIGYPCVIFSLDDWNRFWEKLEKAE